MEENSIERFNDNQNIQSSKRSSILAACLVCLMFIGSVSGVFVEQSNLAYSTPEQLSLPSYLSVVSQIPNLAVLIYLGMRKCIQSQTLQHYTILSTMTLSAMSYILMCFFWKKTFYLFGEERSIPLLFLVLLCSLYDCLSSVTMLPFMAILPTKFLSPLFVGQALAYFIPGVTVLIQGQYEPSQNSTDIHPINSLRISVEAYFGFMGFLTFLSPLSYLLLLYLPSIRKLHVKNADNYKNLSTRCPSHDTITTYDIVVKGRSSSCNLISLLATLFVVVFLQNGILWSILSYSLAPYGAEIYNLGVTLGTIVAAFVCLSYYWYPTKSIHLVYVFSFIFTGLVAYLFVLSFKYPNPWLKTKLFGKIITLFIAIISLSLAPYTRLIIVTILD